MRGIIVTTFVAAFVMLAVPGLMAEEPLNIDETGLTVVLPETILNQVAIANGSYWEPFTDSFGDGKFVVISGAHAIDSNGDPIGDTQTAKFFVIDADGSIEEYWAFTDDSGAPYTGNFNHVRTDGNPPRVCCDRRPGVFRFCVGIEGTPWNFGEFTPTRWEEPFFYDERLVACQLYELTDSGPSAITDVFGGLYYGIDGTQAGGHMRLGGDMRFLSNGNLMICPEDRTSNTVAGTAAVFAIYDGATGARITEPRVAAASGKAAGIWSNCAAFNGGFMVRNSGELTSFDNDGNVIMSVNQTDVSSVGDTGRGDDSRISSNINHETIFLAGSFEDEVYLTKINALTGAEEGEVVVTEEFFLDFLAVPRRVDCSTDENGNIIVWWDCEFISTNTDSMARIYDSNMEPIGKSFYTCTNHNNDIDGDLGIVMKEGNVTMDNERIIVAVNGVTIDPNGQYTADEQTIVTMYENPLRQSISDWDLY